MRDGIGRENGRGTHNFVTTWFLLEVGLHLTRDFEGLVKERNFSAVGERRRNVIPGFINIEAFHINLNVFCGPSCDAVPEAHYPRVHLEEALVCSSNRSEVTTYR